MTDSGRLSRVTLASGTAPRLSVGPHAFADLVEDGEFWGVPREYFDCDRGAVRLDADLASRLEWSIDEELDDLANIAACAQTVTLDGDTMDISPGAFCSYVLLSDIQR